MRDSDRAGDGSGTGDGDPGVGDGEAQGGGTGEARGGSRESDRTLRTDALPEHAVCPFCGGRDTEQFAAFGSALSVSQYYCRPCRTVFEFMKWR